MVLDTVWGPQVLWPLDMLVITIIIVMILQRILGPLKLLFLQAQVGVHRKLQALRLAATFLLLGDLKAQS